MKSLFVPVNGWVICRPIEKTEAEKVTSGGIIIPDSADALLATGEVMFSDANDFILGPGVHVLYPSKEAHPVKINGAEYVRIRDRHIIGVLKPVEQAPT